MKKSNKLLRGRKPKTDAAEFKEVFTKYADVCRNENIKYNNPIFIRISKELNNKITPYAVYKTLKRHYEEFFQNENILEDTPSSQSSSPSPSCRSKASSPLLTKIQANQKFKTFTFTLDMHDWKKIQPILVNYSRRDINTASTHKLYKTLPKFKWATLLREKLWEFSRLPCTWNFKNKNIDSQNNLYITGKCSQCAITAIIKSQTITDKTVNMKCDIIYTEEKEIVHNPKKKSKLTPYRRRQFAKVLQYKPAVVVHKELAAKTMKDTKVNPPVLPSLEALRKIKHEKRKSRRLHSHPIFSILLMTLVSTYNNFVRELTLIPHFHLYYWSKCQIQYYDMYLCTFSKVTITVDATGSFFRAITLPDGTTLTKKLFLYVAMITSDLVKSTPIFQMITDSHSKDSIAEWMKKWVIGVKNAPSEIITDDSAALIAANVSAFTTFGSVKDYIKRSYLVLEGHESVLPEVFLRLDTNHFIKSIYNLRCFANVDLNIKMFYVRCILFLKQNECFQEIKLVITEMVNICLTECDTENLDCKNNIEKLKCKFIKCECDEPNVGSDEKENIGQNTIFDDDNDDVLTWFEEIVQRKKDLNKSGTNITLKSLHPYFMPHLITTLKRLLRKLPLWSNVMCPFYKSDNKTPTSSAIESYFKTMKNLLFGTRLNKYSIDEYIQIHYDYLLGEMNIALASLQNITPEKKEKTIKRKTLRQGKKCYKKRKTNIYKTFSNDSIFSEIPSYIENWRGEGITNNDGEPIMLLQNGNLTIFTFEDITLTNTCAFDSVFFLLALAYKNNIFIRNLLDNTKNKNVLNYLKILCFSNNHDEANRLRIKIASPYFQNNKYSCDCNAAFIYEHIINDLIFSATSISNCSNNMCTNSEPSTRNHIFLPLNLDIIDVFTISSLEEAILIYDWENKQCRKCQKTCISSYSLSKMITFDLNGTQTMLLQDIPQNIVIRQNTYKLLGIIEYIPSTYGSIGHYTCHFIMNDHLLCYDDNKISFNESTKEPVYIHFASYIISDHKEG